jgi:cell filamentation protein
MRDTELDEGKLQPEPFLKAMIASFSGDLGPLAAEIRRMV